MHDWGILIPLFAIMAWVINNWIRARHGYPMEGKKGGRTAPGTVETERTIQLLSAENDKLANQVLRLEERIAVLERIATDPATRVANEIERLR